jgi:hypothetical protein
LFPSFDSKLNYYPNIAEHYKDNPFMDSSNIGHILFEVIMLDRHDDTFHLSHELDNEREGVMNSDSLENTEVLTYLYCCRRRCQARQEEYKNSGCAEVTDFLRACDSIIVENAATCVQQIELFEYQDIVSQFIQLCVEEDLPTHDPQNQPCRFLKSMCEVIESSYDANALTQVTSPILTEVKARLLAPEMSIIHRDAIKYIRVLHFFTATKALAMVCLIST